MDSSSNYVERVSTIKWFQPSINLRRADIDKHINTFLTSFGVKAEIEYRQLKNINDGYNAAYEKREATWSPLMYKTHHLAVGKLKEKNMETIFSSTRFEVTKIVEDYFLHNSKNIDNAVNGNVSPLDFFKKSNWGAMLGSVFNNLLDTIKDYEYKNSSDFPRRSKYACEQAIYAIEFALADLLALNNKEYRDVYPNGNFINIISVWESGLYPVGMVNGKFIVYVPTVNGEFPKQL